MDPRDGSILALASNPTYKPGLYVGRGDPKKLAPLLDPDGGQEGELPGLEPGDEASIRPARRSSR